MTRRITRRGAAWAVLLAAALAAGPAAAAGLTDAEFRKAASSARKLMKRGGEPVAKQGLVATLARDESERALEVLVEWALVSARLRASRLEPAAEKARAEYESYRDKVLQKHGGSRVGWSDAEKDRVRKRRADWQEASQLVVGEVNVQSEIARAIAGVTFQDGITYLAKTGIPKLMKVEGLEPVLEGAVRLLLTQPPSVAGDGIVNAVVRPLSPQIRIQALDWIALEMIDGAAVRITPCLESPSVPVRRAALRALKALDDPRVVPSLIASLESSSGLLASETEDVLHNFTGQTFSQDGAAWSRWFKEHGDEWLKRADKARHGANARHGDVSFYGIVSPSDRIMFVLDRSGSMQHPAMEAGKADAVVTGGGEGAPTHAAGQTKLQVAKAELRRAINRLGVDVKFNVCFYDHKVVVWKEPPTLVPATRENKAAARTWFEDQKPGGSTELFAALMRALDYGDDLSKPSETGERGVDTIFLLSDGAPTTGVPARLLTDEEIEQAVTTFLQANRLRRCVVHTIGVGPQHNRPLMKRLAAETGGTYVAVGMEQAAADGAQPAAPKAGAGGK